ncbi:helicase-related protein [Kineococcus auxinigenes]|uniref:helicase-related protein n=1 Tax=unclassified Kineococcus TaxID=2621656 RepID=UPI003D7C87A4
MSRLDPWYEARAEVVRALEADLLGGPEDELLTEAPLDRFIVGILRPRSAGEVSAEEQDTPEDGVGGADAVFDPAVALTRTRYPSSMGLTFAVDVRETASVTVSVDAARYRLEEGAQEDVGDTAPEPTVIERGRSLRRRDERWHRVPLTVADLDVPISPSRSESVPVAPGLDLHVVARPPADHVVNLTLVLVNTLAESPERQDGACWFQPRLRVRTGSGGFAERPRPRPTGVEDEDLESYDLLFRDVRNVAVGHGCAVEWRDAPVVTEVTTTFIPRHDVPLSQPGGPDADGLRMQHLADTGDTAGLRTLLAAYRSWIDDEQQKARNLSEALLETVVRHLSAARQAADRIERGIDLLERDPQAMSAFRGMNAAMQLQRSRQEMIRSGASVPNDEQHTWRPFQIAFILLNLVGLTKPDSEDREIADLLWFPTGGGKTEAYLGLVGYTVLLRRLRNLQDAGVSVLMRYTLRLLTIQQFERAAGLICALEQVRRESIPASRGISLGLWVGRAATPNTVKEARLALRESNRRAPEDDEGSPMQLLRCPWCGSRLGREQYVVESGDSRLTVRCSNAKCTFADALPVFVVDEDVYRERPSLVIGTVDKFAMLAWKEEAGALFSTDGENSPPDLVVQDELHLISGPLGTMVGLYETAVDAACSRAGHKPKVVASTATIRRAGRQVQAVFAREAQQFPPSGIDADDSFFAVQASPQEKGTRQYVGVLAPGVSQATLLVRSFAALLQAAEEVDTTDEVRDAYWTLLGYFNSLRVLGGAYMQVIDDVPARLKVLAERHGVEPRKVGTPREMTSRKRSSEIPRELEILGTAHPDDASPPVVLATNMISVGVDVDRLGLMAVVGQPQTTAEYIQATSRVGRKHPGLVCVLYNGSRTRDLSHYESFATYHRSLYRQVEATGATPFAARARDRGLHGVLVALVRLLVADASGDRSAGAVDGWGDDLDTAVEVLVERARRVDEDEADDVEDQLEKLVEMWRQAADDEQVERYAGWRDARKALLAPSGSDTDRERTPFPVDLPPWSTLTSLRDVDTETTLQLRREKRNRTRGE